VKVLVNNQLLEYKDEGSGRVLVLLHGWGTSLGTFDQLAGHLAQNFRVIRFDFPGFGQSPKPADDWSVRSYAEITKALFEKLNIDEVYAVIAHSFGGRVVIKGVKQGLLAPKNIVLIGSAGVKPNQSASKSFYRTVAKVGKLATSVPGLRKVQPPLRKRLYSAAGSTDYLQAKQMQPIFLNVINEDLLPEVVSITQPTLLIWGKDDSETPLRDAHLMLASLGNGHLVVVPDAGHFVYTEAYDTVISELNKFLL
jgi:pimeloyl-ACP methyl ester carboxylesterase